MSINLSRRVYPTQFRTWIPLAGHGKGLFLVAYITTRTCRRLSLSLRVKLTRRLLFKSSVAMEMTSYVAAGWNLALFNSVSTLFSVAGIWGLTYHLG
ncbi:hypothetical protein BRARA_D00447 [Brassica rapa]|uniref:Uncharacterized protein n=1 Tax=Brassica campestris TaxID=3711 RepID=A0A397ZQ83_BRACM|nr:hypothetical protein BRARA_D00447 [Brassica rapa]RID65236.1 hypothetical protein BRARA_D00447 [Brassica rapa]RID65237.1 hypothetical protein BRARA_D00447 [Brassica rapa]